MVSILQRMDQERALTDGQRDEFEDMLRALTLERSQIREAMGFALDNAEAAGEVPHWVMADALFSSVIVQSEHMSMKDG